MIRIRSVVKNHRPCIGVVLFHADGPWKSSGIISNGFPFRGCSIVLLFSPILIQAPIMHVGKALFTIGSSRTDSPEYETSFQKTFTSNRKPCAVFSLDTVSMKCCWRLSQSEAQWAGERRWLTLTWEQWIESGPGQTGSLYCPLYSHRNVPAHWRYKPHKLPC